jgi:hypothetical protein
MTGRGVFVRWGGLTMLRVRQSSEPTTRGSPEESVVACVHGDPIAVAERTPVHGVTGAGGCQRRSPIGGAA